MGDANTEIQSAGICMKSLQSVDMVKNANLEDVCFIIHRDKVGIWMMESRILIKNWEKVGIQVKESSMVIINRE